MSYFTDIITLHFDYIDGRAARENAFLHSAVAYSTKFDAAYECHQQQRAEDRRQWLTVILPAIKNEAALLRYERGLDKESATAEAQIV